MTDESKEWKTAAPLILHIAIWIVSIIISIFIAIGLIFLAGVFADWYYNSHHLIPNPAERGDDLGLGLVTIFSMTVAFVLTVPLTIPLTRLVVKLLSNAIARIFPHV